FSAIFPRYANYDGTVDCCFRDKWADRRRPWIWAAGFRGGWARGAAPRCHLLNDSRCVNAFDAIVPFSLWT
uniref:Uncharacterized protein n=1 Tax=Aegilops tauschii subsp. strangulata TaxID=200361 RepID=A0A453G782_AEGTS